MSDDDQPLAQNAMMEKIAFYLYPALRMAAALGVVWFASSSYK